MSRARTSAPKPALKRLSYGTAELGRKITQCKEDDTWVMFMATSLPEIWAHRGRPKKWYCGPIKDSYVLRQATHL